MEGQQATVGGTFVNFAGNTTLSGFTSLCCIAQNGTVTTWTLDTEASDHISYDLNLFTNMNVLRPDKSYPTGMTRNERTKILLELIPEIINLKFTRTENDPYGTELEPNIFCLNHFSVQEKPIGPPKIN